MDLKELTEEPHAKLIMALVAIFGLVLALRAYESAKNNAAATANADAATASGLSTTAPIDQTGTTGATTNSNGTTSSTPTTAALPSILNLGFVEDLGTVLSGEDVGSGQSSYNMQLAAVNTDSAITTGTSGGSGINIGGISIGFGGSGTSSTNSNTTAGQAAETLSAQSAYDSKGTVNQSNAFTSTVSLENPTTDELTQVLGFLQGQTATLQDSNLAQITQNQFAAQIHEGEQPDNVATSLTSNAPNPILQVTV